MASGRKGGKGEGEGERKGVSINVCMVCGVPSRKRVEKHVVDIPIQHVR